MPVLRCSGLVYDNKFNNILFANNSASNVISDENTNNLYPLPTKYRNNCGEFEIRN